MSEAFVAGRAEGRAAELWRVARVLRRAGVLGSVRPGRLPAMARLAVKAGLSARSVVAQSAEAHPEREAFVDAERRLTYAAAATEIDALAAGLAARYRIGQRTPVLLMMENSATYLVVWIALLRLGARAVHASWRSTPGELEHLVSDSGARVIVASERALSAAYAMAARAEPTPAVVRAGNVEETAPEIADTVEELVRRGRGAALPWGGREAAAESVVYTSGTTGKPKGAVRDLAAAGIVELARILERLPMRAGDRHLVVAPLYHSAAQALTMMQLGLGGTIVVRPRFEAADAVTAIADEAIDSCFMVPTMIRGLVDHLEAHPSAERLRTLRYVLSGAARFDDALRRRAVAALRPTTLFDFYGATEMGWVTLIDGGEMLARPGSVGRPLGGQQIRVVDEAGAPLPCEATGVVQVRNRQAMVGYLNHAGADGAGWQTVEDLGRLDADGYLYLQGRARDMVISGGVNLYPAEIELALGDHPDVVEIAVVGLPDEQWGERLAAAVVWSDEAEFDPDALEAYARERLSGPKIPRSWHRVDALPRNPTGKILKRQLRDDLSPTRLT